ncbi:MAG TPA: cell division protein FtsK [Lentisphaeria bacterium]|nr:MAG: hypothetical protein A2X47_07825 [Lentisphaerae bacterium GWF2_38_69]HBM16466.1 cell division protein FtsK [Lentisphaeria bacterium]
MKQSNSRRAKQNINENIPHRKVTISKVLFLIFSILFLLAILTHHSIDDAIAEGGKSGQISNWIGYFGAVISRVIFNIFGLAGYFLGVYLFIASLQSLFKDSPIKKRALFLSIILFLAGFSIFFALWPETFAPITSNIGINTLSGGVFGQLLASPPNNFYNSGFIRQYMGTVGTCIISITLIAIGFLFIWEEKVFLFFKNFFSFFTSHAPVNDEVSKAVKGKQSKDESSIEKIKKEIELKRAKEKLSSTQTFIIDDDLFNPVNTKSDNHKEQHLEVPPVSSSLSQRTMIISTNSNEFSPAVREKIVRKSPLANSSYKIPSLKILDMIEEASGESRDAVQKSKETLQDTLNSFGVEAKVTDAITGPRITRLEIVPSPGVKLDKITSLEANIKLDLRAECIRILAPIPGKDAVGIEIPNKISSPVSLFGILNSSQWKKSSHGIPVALGKSVSGEPIIADLARAPHLLIAGSTGSGKSVCINTLIMSLLYRFTPDELRMILVDPKVVEFETYKKLPHLITPIVNDPRKVPLALRWAINEMERRYRVLAKVRVKNLESFNSRPKGEEIVDDDGKLIPLKLPYIVIILDELADIMMIAKADVETSICRIAQKARAVGIHLVVATQRPSKEIITGVIKANLPTRIAFKVSSMIDSRVILDQNGAETLLGRGDMLFIPPGSAKLERIQGAMVSDGEIERVAAASAEQMEQKFDDRVIAEEEPQDDIQSDDEYSDTAPSAIDEKADLMDRAIDLVKRERKATTSYLQRRLGIGYNKAANIIENMEKQGMIGPILSPDGKREIYITEEDKRI